jgi:hypothetical protein
MAVTKHPTQNGPQRSPFGHFGRECVFVAQQLLLLIYFILVIFLFEGLGILPFLAPHTIGLEGKGLAYFRFASTPLLDAPRA